MYLHLYVIKREMCAKCKIVDLQKLNIPISIYGSPNFRTHNLDLIILGGPASYCRIPARVPRRLHNAP